MISLPVVLMLMLTVSVYAQAVVPIFTPTGTNPVLQADASWEGGKIDSVAVIFDGGQYKAWYTAGKNIGGFAYSSIGYATSPDGMTWTKYASNPVLTGTAGSWDNSSVGFPSVLKVGNQYHMYYRGLASSSIGIGLATSSDGISWTKSASNPVLVVSEGATQPNVLFVSSQWKMWFRNRQGTHILYATSADGKSWSVIGNAIDLPTGRVSLNLPWVIFDGSNYWMWFAATTTNVNQTRLYYATSSSGQSWTVYDQDPLSGTAASEGTVVPGATSYMWFRNPTGKIYLAQTTMPVPEFGSITAIVPLVLTVITALFAAARARRYKLEDHPT